MHRFICCRIGVEYKLTDLNSTHQKRHQQEEKPKGQGQKRQRVQETKSSRENGQKRQRAEGRPYLVCRDALHVTQPGAHLQLIACCWITAGKVLEHCVYHGWSDLHSQYILNASPLYNSQSSLSADMNSTSSLFITTAPLLHSSDLEKGTQSKRVVRPYLKVGYESAWP